MGDAGLNKIYSVDGLFTELEKIKAIILSDGEIRIDLFYLARQEYRSSISATDMQDMVRYSQRFKDVPFFAPGRYSFDDKINQPIFITPFPS